LSPKNQSASHELNSHDLALTLWELERLFFDSLQSDLSKSKISCNEKRFFVGKKAFQRFFVNFRQDLFGKSCIFVYLRDFNGFVVPIKQFVSEQVNTLDMAHGRNVLTEFLLIIVVNDFNKLW
jgi:hypothetical protein